MTEREILIEIKKALKIRTTILTHLTNYKVYRNRRVHVPTIFYCLFFKETFFDEFIKKCKEIKQITYTVPPCDGPNKNPYIVNRFFVHVWLLDDRSLCTTIFAKDLFVSL